MMYSMWGVTGMLLYLVVLGGLYGILFFVSVTSLWFVLQYGWLFYSSFSARDVEVKG